MKETDPRKRLGLNVRQRRLELELSQEKLTDLAGLHRTYIGAIERGERNVSLLNIVAVARALDVLPSQLLGRVE